MKLKDIFETDDPRKFRRDLRKVFGKNATAKPKRGFRPDLSKAKKPSDLPSTELWHFNQVKKEEANKK